MNQYIRNALQYIVIFGVTALLVWISLRGLDVVEGDDKWQYLAKTWNQADKGWLIAMAVLAMISHVFRAERWRMLIAPSGNTPKLGDAFHSLMVGYLVNLAIPRGGEVSRCYNLYRLDKTPINISFGTVVVERIIDLICLLILIAAAFILESDKLVNFVASLNFGGGGVSNVWIIVLIVILFLILLIFILYKRNERFRNFTVKSWQGFREGFLSVFRLKNNLKFFVLTFLIWFLYFAMSYAVTQSFDSTSSLGLEAVLSLFAIGSIAMAAPLPGGTGSYHVLVPNGLYLLYQIPMGEAIAFTFIFHAWQTMIMIVAGAISLILTSIIIKRRKRRQQINQA